MNSLQPIILAVTGCIASGKTEAGHILAAEGFKVLDTDLLAHELMRRGTWLYSEMVGRFGERVVGTDGEINRKELGRIVFADAQALADLNRLVHPEVIRKAGEWIGECRNSGEDAAVLVPLLFETGWIEGWSAVLCIMAPEDQIRRRLAGRGLTPQDADARLAAQWPQHQKAARAGFIIENGGTKEDLRLRIYSVLATIRGE